MPLSHAILAGVRLVGKFMRAHHCPVKVGVGKHLFHRSCVGHHTRKKQAAKQVCRQQNGILEQKRHGLDDDTFDSGTRHGTGQRNSKLFKNVGVSLRYRYSWTESRENHIMALQNLLQFDTVLQFTPPDSDLILERTEPLRRANKRLPVLTDGV
jgi:hypothetical protein